MSKKSRFGNDLTKDLADMLHLLSEKYKDDMSVHEYNKSRLLVKTFEIRSKRKDEIEKRFKQAFPEFSTVIIEWFRKHKYLL